MVPWPVTPLTSGFLSGSYPDGDGRMPGWAVIAESTGQPDHSYLREPLCRGEANVDYCF
ncbi:hypothetical protein BH24ACT9_BH24ACT9_01640 [soil metagenome]